MFNKIKKLIRDIIPGEKGRALKGTKAAILDISEGFVDITLPVVHVNCLEDGTVVVKAVGKIAGGLIGFQIDVQPDWNRQVGEDGNLILYWGTVRYRALGEASDRFVETLAQLFGLPAGASSMAPSIDFTAVALMTDPREIISSRQDLKLFYDNGADDTYAEVFTNIDLKAGQIEFREKDQDYRSNLISALTDVKVKNVH
jgi:hypothetical protein